jgi:hypothetical protein
MPSPVDRRDRLMETALLLRDVNLTGRGPFTHIEGRAVPYRTWADIGWFLEQHEVDSLKQSTTAGTGKTLPLHLFHDNRAWPIGGSVDWRSGADGLHGVWCLNDLPEAQEAARLARSGELGYLSIGFSPRQSKWEFAGDWDPDLGWDHMDRVTRTESRLLEVSLVSTPAFEEAEVTLVRQHRATVEDEESVDREAYVRWREARIAAQLRAAGVPLPATTPHLDEWKRQRAHLERYPSSR